MTLVAITGVWDYDGTHRFLFHPDAPTLVGDPKTGLLNASRRVLVLALGLVDAATNASLVTHPSHPEDR